MRWLGMLLVSRLEEVLLIRLLGVLLIGLLEVLLLPVSVALIKPYFVERQGPTVVGGTEVFNDNGVVVSMALCLIF